MIIAVITVSLFPLLMMEQTRVGTKLKTNKLALQI